MATTAQLTALAGDALFRQRIRNIVLQEAAVVYNEGTGVTNHAGRATFAIKLLQSPGLADQVADVIVTQVNLSSSGITYDFDRRAVVTDATDAAILSQVASAWNMLSGV
jgi:hypothetical protein